MNLQVEKRSLIEELIGLNDIEVILKIKNLLKKSSKTSVQPMDIEAFYARIDASEKAFQKGETISQSELEREVKTWKRTK